MGEVDHIGIAWKMIADDVIFYVASVAHGDFHLPILPTGSGLGGEMVKQPCQPLKCGGMSGI